MGMGSESAVVLRILAGSGLLSERGLSSRRSRGGEYVNEIESRTEETSNNQILFPMAVGVLFLVVLVAGALLG